MSAKEIMRMRARLHIFAMFAMRFAFCFSTAASGLKRKASIYWRGALWLVPLIIRPQSSHATVIICHSYHMSQLSYVTVVRGVPSHGNHIYTAEKQRVFERVDAGFWGGLGAL
jgi:hypothetical protein